MRGKLLVAAAVVLVTSACGGEDGQPSEPEATVTVTADPAENPDVESQARYPTANDVLSAAQDAGFTCARPRQTASATRASSHLYCGQLYSQNAAFFRVYDTENAVSRDLVLFERVAKFDLRDGDEPLAVLGASNGATDGYWLIRARLETVTELRRQLGGKLLDYTKIFPNVRPAPAEPEPSAAPKLPAIPTTFSDGTYLVGTDVQAGTYRNDGDTYGGQAPCVAYTSTEASDINTFITGSTTTGPGILQIEAGQYLSVQGCKTWSIDR